MYRGRRGHGGREGGTQEGVRHIQTEWQEPVDRSGEEGKRLLDGHKYGHEGKGGRATDAQNT